MATIFAARAGAETTLLERTRDGGRKILISGGGRCNVLPMRLDESRFVTDSSPNLLRKMLRSWPLREQIAFFENELRLPLAEEAESSKLFPVSNKARDVRDGLLALRHACRRDAAYEYRRHRLHAARWWVARGVRRRTAGRRRRGDRGDRRTLGAEHRQRRSRAARARTARPYR